MLLGRAAATALATTSSSASASSSGLVTPASYRALACAPVMPLTCQRGAGCSVVCSSCVHSYKELLVRPSASFKHRGLKGSGPGLAKAQGGMSHCPTLIPPQTHMHSAQREPAHQARTYPPTSMSLISSGLAPTAACSDREASTHSSCHQPADAHIWAAMPAHLLRLLCSACMAPYVTPALA